MILKGKYNEAEVYTDNIDNNTISQIINLCNQEAFKDSNIKIMPDCHAGKGCTIGTTMTITDKVVPNLVGVDIGCGMATVDLKTKHIDYNKLDNVIRKHVPHGASKHSRSRDAILKEVFGIDLANIKCKVDLNIAYKSAGTLGGGNHFIEINQSEDGKLYLTVHTGSRNLGKQIAEAYQEIAINTCNDKSLSEDLRYLEGDLMKDYLHDMEIAQRYSAANRVLILTAIIYNYNDCVSNFSSFCKEVKKEAIECIHNYIDMNTMILRKGAISAKEGEQVIIPINMKDGIILGVGKGNDNWNQSAPHGAGRILSRGQAKEKIDLEEYKESMKDVFTTCVSRSTLDEAPQAYKPIEDILAYVYETIDVTEIVKPVYNFKSN